MRLIRLFLVVLVIILMSGCSYIQQFREKPMGQEEEPFISIIPEDELPAEEVVKETEEIKEETAKPLRLEVNEGELVKLKLAATDPDGDKLTYIFSQPLNEKGEWQTKKGDAGEYKVKIIVDDGKISTQQEILIVVNALNKAPILKLENEITVNEGEKITLTPEVSDPDGDKVTVIYSGWMNSATYTTNYNDAGVHTVTITASDGKTETTQNVKITVNDVNRPPVIESITLE